MTAPVAPVVRHLRYLTANGCIDAGVAEVARLRRATVLEVRNRKVTPRPGTADALLAVTVSKVAASSASLVPACGTRRRLWSLMAIGHPRADLSEQLGWWVPEILASGIVRIDRQIRLDVIDLHARLSDTPGRLFGTSQHRATESRHAPPLAWAGVDIEDPAARPRGSADSAAPAAADALHLIRGGVALEEAAARCGVAVDSVLTHLRRLARRSGPGSADAALHAQLVAARIEAAQTRGRQATSRRAS